MSSIDTLFAVVTAFGVALIFLTGLVIWDIISTGTVDETIFQKSSIGPEIKSHGQTTFNNLDTFFVLIFFATHIGILVLAFALRSHPIIYLAGLLLILMIAILSAPLSNAWVTATQTSALSASVSSLGMTDYIMKNLPFIEIVWSFLSLIVMAGLARSEGIV